MAAGQATWQEHEKVIRHQKGNCVRFDFACRLENTEFFDTLAQGSCRCVLTPRTAVLELCIAPNLPVFSEGLRTKLSPA